MDNGKASECVSLPTVGRLRIQRYRYFDYAILPILEKTIRLLNTAQGETMGNERRCIDSSLFNETENLCTITTIHASRFEGKILAIHIRQGEYLRLIIQCDNSDYGIGSGTFPGQLKCILPTRYFQDPIGSAMITMPQYELLTTLRLNDQYFRIVLPYKPDSLWILFADNNPFRMS